MNKYQKANLRYSQAVAKLESEARRAKASVTLLKMLYNEMKKEAK
jgi:hypothetical protein